MECSRQSSQLSYIFAEQYFEDAQDFLESMSGHVYECRLHLYGDIYSSPGVSMRQKQLLMAAFLGQANMHDQLFGHLIAVRSCS